MTAGTSSRRENRRAVARTPQNLIRFMLAEVWGIGCLLLKQAGAAPVLILWLTTGYVLSSPSAVYRAVTVIISFSGHDIWRRETEQQKSGRKRNNRMRKILIKGAGVGGLAAAYELLSRGADITIAAPAGGPAGSASWYAGGMLAPYCERESAEPIIEELGLEAMKWWDKVLPGLVRHHGTLVVAPARDNGELDRFSERTNGHEKIGAARLGTLEPDLAGRFQRGLFYAAEAHIDPRRALAALKNRLENSGVAFVAPGEDETRYDLVIDATGPARLASDRELRGVRGEMLLVRTADICFSRPVRLLHPRIPLYVAPREDNIFMIGASMIESDNAGPITARSMMEFLNAAYSLHPAFAEAEIVETGVGIRPAYADNLPRVKRQDKTISINGFYRHGYLLAPEMAVQAAKLAFS